MHSPAPDPFWGPQTSYLNFCEEDYVLTKYVAEFVNTFSSFVFIIYGLYGLRKLHGNRQATVSRSIPYFGLMGVGVCSAGYHMTLKYHTQMSDELSMHLLTTPLLYRLLTFKASPQRTRLIGSILLVEFAVVMVVHMVMDEFLLHAVTFGLGVYLIATRALKIIPMQISNPSIRKNVRNIALFGCFCFVFGYMVWLIDEWACSQLTNIRHSVGVPLAFLFELHGWWHIFTAIGGYVAVAVVDFITSGEVNNDPTDNLAWPLPLAARFLGAAADSKKGN
ncbi:alkaline phytoceramidase [Aspergillus granulosus]|uniref:Alkaline phytoceramidase n=1 Tax=Aspergillus granulosus TaxID=176169 RepID=A0ABR4H7V9_9EURO